MLSKSSTKKSIAEASSTKNDVLDSKLLSFYGEESSLDMFFANKKDLILKDIAVNAAKDYFDLALKIVEFISSDYQRDKTLRQIANVQLLIGELNRAIHVCQLIKNGNNKAKLLSNIALIQARKKEKLACLASIEASLTYINDLTDLDRQEFFWRLSVAQAAINETKLAIETADKIQETIVKTSAFCNIAMELFDDFKDINEVKKILAKACEIAKKCKEKNFRVNLFSPNYFSNIINPLSIVAVTYANVYCFEEAIRTVETIPWDKEHAISLEKTLEKGLVEGKDYFLCKTCATHFMELEFNEMMERPRTFSKIAIIMASMNYFDDSLLIAKMIDFDSQYIHTLADLGKMFQKSKPYFAKKCLDIAQQVIIRIQSRNLDSFLNELANSYNEIKDFESAIQTAHQIESKFLCAKILAVIGKSFSYAKGLNGSIPILEEAMDNAMGVNDLRSRVEIISQVALEQSLGGHEELARFSFNFAFDSAKIFEDDYERFLVMRKVASFQAKSNNPDAAKNKFNEIQEMAKTVKDERHLIYVAIDQAKAGFSDDALDTVKKIVKSIDVSDLANVFVSKCEKKNFELLLKYGSFDNTSLIRMAVLASKICPDQALEIAEIVNEFCVSSNHSGNNFNSELNEVLKSLGF